MSAPVALRGAPVRRASRRRPRPQRDRLRVRLADGTATTVHVVAHPRATTSLRVALPRSPLPLRTWCDEQGVAEALVGGFFVRPHGTPLGEVRTSGIERRHVPFAGPWAGVRACVLADGDDVRVARRDDLPLSPPGDLLQAGPLLVCDGSSAVSDLDDPEGFSARSEQFDSDITDGRYPRAALGVSDDALLAVAVDGRSRRDAGLTLGELADVLLDLGAHAALNLDGGGSASLVSGGRLRNRPRGAFESEVPGGRAVSSALVFAPRG